MTVETFFANFGHLADAPNGVQKLRELILQLAVQGKLVPQNPSDEPASVLLERIEAEKKRLVKEGVIKKLKPLPPVTNDEIPFGLPNSWAWTRLGYVTTYGMTDKAELHEVTEATWVLELEDVEKVTSYLLQRVRCKDRLFRSSKNKFQKGDVIYGKLRPYLDKVLVADEPGVCTTEMLPMRGYLGIFPEYLRWALKTPTFIEYANSSTHGMNLPRLGTDKGRLAPFPLPPLEEQKRIVAKVDQLMALCDELEVRHQKQQQGRVRLNNAALDALLTAREPDEFADHWQRISTNFDLLYDHPETIAKLRAAILQLAVQGKLVPHDPNAEPSSVLLERIKAEKERLVKEGNIKKQKALPVITEDEKPFKLPMGWEFVRFGDITSRIGSGSTPRGGKNAYVQTGVPFIRSQNVRNNGLGLRDVAYITETTHEKMSNTVVYPDDILLNITGASLGRCTIFPDGIGEANVSQHVSIIRPTDPATTTYLHLCILSPYTQALVWGRQVGMAREGLSKKVLELFEIPLPPLEEQKRIVAKVDQLMALCDELEAQLNQSQKHSEKLMEATVRQLLIS